MLYDELYSIPMKSKDHVDEYVKFIELCKSEDLPDYTEKHHILPKSLFPGFAKSKDNIVKMSASNHFKAHMILAKAFGGPMWVAANCLTHNRYGDRKITAEEYELIKINLSAAISDKLKADWANGKRSKDEASVRMISQWEDERLREIRTTSIRKVAATDEFKKKSSLSTRASWADEDQRAQRLASMNETMQTAEYKNKHSVNQKARMQDPELRAKCGWNMGKNSPREWFPELTCPHCNKVGLGGAMKRYHFDNCKLKLHN